MTRLERRPGIVAPAIVLFAVLLAAAGAESAFAGSVNVDIGIVVASNQGTSVDPSLSALRSKLQSMFNYSSYRMLDRAKRTLAVGETGDFVLPGGRSMRVTPAPAPANKVRLAVQMMEGDRNLLTTTLGLSRGGMVLVGGPPYRSGVLILLISAE
jgi:hypothetical protein